MEEIRILIQSKLSEITSIKSGVPIPDGMVEESQTYFGYELANNYRGSDFDKNYTMEISLTGRLVRKELSSEDTLHELDSALALLISKLKELNFKCSYNDITFDSSIRKIFVKGTVKYNELNNQLII